jgi:cell division septation protein DedD
MPSAVASANAAPARGAMLASARQAPPPPAVAPASSRGFGLVSTAQAASLPAGIRPVVATTQASGGIWAVQVGAFANEGQARSAADHARGAGSGGRVAVQKVAQGRSTLYRARVTGLTQGSAQQLCERLRARGACIVLSPDAQQG